MYFSHLVVSLPWVRQGSTSHFFSFPYLSVLLPSERVCSHSCIHLRLSRYRMRRRDVLVTNRSTFLRCVSTAISISPLMRATYHLIVIDDFYDLFSHPTLALPHIPCTYLPLLSLSFIVCCFVIPFPFTALFRACTPGSLEVKYFLGTSFP